MEKEGLLVALCFVVGMVWAYILETGMLLLVD